jgi:MFS family permease
MNLFREADYRRLWLAGGFVGVIRWLELLAISVYVYDVTGSAFQTALMTFFRFLPMVMLGAVLGAIAERVTRRSFMLAVLVLPMVTATLLGVLAMTGAIAIWQIAAGAFLVGAVHATDFPVRRTMMGEVAGSARAHQAFALDAVANNATRLLGPVGGGVLYDQIGLHGAYFLSTALYALGLFLVLRVHHRGHPQRSGKSHYLTNIAEGLRFIRRRRVIVGALLVTIIVNMFAVPFTAVIPVIGKGTLSLSASLVGVLASAEGVGALIGAMAIAWLQPANFTRTYLLGSFLFLAGVLTFAGASAFAIALVLLFAAGIGHAGFSTTQSAIMFAAATPEMRSRVLGVLAMCIGAGPAGVLHLGLMAEWLGAPWAVAIMTAEGLLLLAAVAVAYPEIYRGQSGDPVSDSAAE